MILVGRDLRGSRESRAHLADPDFQELVDKTAAQEKEVSQEKKERKAVQG